MSTLAYPLDSAIERLKSVEGVALVGIAPDFASLRAAAPRVVPAVFVLSETAGGPFSYSGDELVQQKRTTRLILLVWVSQHGEAAEAVRDMRRLLECIDARLAGWTPGDAFSSLRFISSRDELYGNPYLVTRVVYEASWDFITPSQP